MGARGKKTPQSPDAPASKLRVKRQERFLQEFRQCGNVAESCRRMAMSPTAVSDWRENFPEFEAAFQIARRECPQGMESFVDNRLSKLTDAEMEARLRCFLKFYSECGIVTRACEWSGVSTTTVKLRIQNDTAFAQLYQEAHERAAGIIEAEIIRRAVTGVEKLIFDKNGKAVKDPRTGRTYVERVYDNKLLEFLAKGFMREKYGDQQRIDFSKATDADVIERAKQLGLYPPDSALPTPSDTIEEGDFTVDEPDDSFARVETERSYQSGI
jgi:hypothetical protein